MDWTYLVIFLHCSPNCLPFTHLHTNGGCYHARRCPTHWSNLGLSVFPKCRLRDKGAYFKTQTPAVIVQPAQPTEPQSPHC